MALLCSMSSKLFGTMNERFDELEMTSQQFIRETEARLTLHKASPPPWMHGLLNDFILIWWRYSTGNMQQNPGIEKNFHEYLHINLMHSYQTHGMVPFTKVNSGNNDKYHLLSYKSISDLFHCFFYLSLVQIISPIYVNAWLIQWIFLDDPLQNSCRKRYSIDVPFNFTVINTNHWQYLNLKRDPAHRRSFCWW